MMKETQQEKLLPKCYRWADLEKADGGAGAARRLPRDAAPPRPRGLGAGCRRSDANASTSIKVPKYLKVPWWEFDSTRSTGRRHAPTAWGPVRRAAGEERDRGEIGAGRYFTPRPLIDAMVAGETPGGRACCRDPVAGTGGFLIAADCYAKAATDGYFILGKAEQDFQRLQAFYSATQHPIYTAPL